MPDVVDKQTRSRMMSGIRGKNTRPELLVRHELHRRGFRYRLHVRGMPGVPDLVLPKYHAVVFVHGCYWHRHPGCRYTTTPGTNLEFWIPKFHRTVEHDREVIAKLRDQNWRIATVWECVTRREPIEEIGETLGSWLRADGRMLELPDLAPSAGLNDLDVYRQTSMRKVAESQPDHDDPTP